MAAKPPPPRRTQPGWSGGRVSTHAELDAADQQFWREAGPSARVGASILLSLEAWALSHPNETSPGFDRAVFGIRRRRRTVPAGGGARGSRSRPSALDERRGSLARPKAQKH